MSEPTCTAADGKTVVYSIPGYPLMVRAVDFNALFGATHHAAPGAPQQEASGEECERCGEPRSAHTTTYWCDNQSFRAAATAPAGGVTDERAEFERQARAEGFPAVRMQPGDAVYSDSGSHAAWWGWKARAALTTAARAAAATAPQQEASGEPVAFPFYELRFIMRVLGHKGSAPREDWETAYGMARKVFITLHPMFVGPPPLHSEAGKEAA